MLREIQLEDVNELFRLHSNPEVQKYTGEAPLTSLEEMRAAIARREAHYREHGFGRWATFIKEENQFVGWAGLAYLPEFDEIDLGYRLLPEFWGQGMATEASEAILQYGFETLGLQRIVAIAMRDNVASIRVMEKVGMQFEKWAPYEPGGDDVAWYVSEPNIFKQHIQLR